MMDREQLARTLDHDSMGGHNTRAMMSDSKGRNATMNDINEGEKKKDFYQTQPLSS